eukprot:scaffold3221_cov194-Amphora_coffeaeformis.AAC.2
MSHKNNKSNNKNGNDDTVTKEQRGEGVVEPKEESSPSAASSCSSPESLKYQITADESMEHEYANDNDNDDASRQRKQGNIRKQRLLVLLALVLSTMAVAIVTAITKKNRLAKDPSFSSSSSSSSSSSNENDTTNTTTTTTTVAQVTTMAPSRLAALQPTLTTSSATTIPTGTHHHHHRPSTISATTTHVPTKTSLFTPQVNTDHVSHSDVPSLSNNPTFATTFTTIPSTSPSTNAPIRIPTLSPSHAPPTMPPTTADPSLQPTADPTTEPSQEPSTFPTTQPTDTPTTKRPTTPRPTTPKIETTTFLVIGDVPYNAQQAREFTVQMDNVVAGSADFMVHVGDIRSAADGARCTLAEYQAVADILQRSKVPIFVIPGDNEWNDCPNRAQAWEYWIATFQAFESQHWSHEFGIERMPNRPETFSFVWRGTLFVGLNLVGGTVHSRTEWQTRLTDEVEWVQTLVRRHQKPTVVFGHANPVNNHDDFFLPLRNFVRDELQNSIPLLYVNGDKHQWRRDEATRKVVNSQSFVLFHLLQANWQRLMVSGGTTDPPLLVKARAGPSIQTVRQAFSYDRQL